MMQTMTHDRLVMLNGNLITGTTTTTTTTTSV